MIHVQVWQPGRRPKLCPTGTAISAETTARLAHISIAASSQTVKKYYSTTAHQTLSHEELCKSNGPRRWSTQFSAAKNSVQHKRKSLKSPFMPDYLNILCCDLSCICYAPPVIAFLTTSEPPVRSHCIACGFVIILL